MNRKEKALEFVDTDYNIQITGRHVDVTESMKAYAIEKISKIERFMDRIIDVNVIMETQKIDQKVEIILKANNFKISSQATTSDMYASIDKAAHKLEAQLLRYKSKIQNHHAKGHAVLDMNVDVLAKKDAEEWEYEQLDKEPSTEFVLHQVVKQERRPLKVLTKDEAVMKMELSGDNFLIYKDEIDSKLRIIYRRVDGDYGIINPIAGY